jgi:hypothetical protein
VDNILLVACELVTNGVRHAQTPLTLTLSRTSKVVLLSVHDGSTMSPSPHSSAETGEGGYGLGIVELLSLAWGVDTDDSAGKTIWATFDTGPPRCTPKHDPAAPAPGRPS